MNFTKSIEYIHSLLAFGIQPGLERIGKLLALLGNPQDKIKTVHIAGTNGKGSTSTMLSNMLIAEGHRVGLFTSPYVIDFCERIQINGENIDKNILAEAVTRVREKIEELNRENIIITEFEAITATAFICFCEQGCDWVVLEVGLGGRFDATNTVKSPEAAVITSISLDHTKILGDTLPEIAFEKCGIIKRGTRVITSFNQRNEVLSVITKASSEMGARLTITNPKAVTVVEDNIHGTKFLYKNNQYETHLTGAHQIENTVNAIETANVLGLSQTAIFEGIKSTKMIARMELIGENPLIIRDGGHNEGCALALRDFLIKYDVKNINMLIGLMADKDCEGYVGLIAPLCKSVVTVTPSNPRALGGEELMAIAQKHCGSVKFINNPKEGYKYILENTEKNEALLVCGSFYMMSDIFGEN